MSSLYKNWKSLIKDQIDDKRLFIDLESGLKTRIIHFPDEQTKSITLPKNTGRDYWNILEPLKRVFTKEFHREQSSALLLRNGDYEEEFRQCRKIYFSPSVNLDRRKRDLLKIDPGLQVNFGVDPYSLGLWESKLFKSLVDLDFLSSNQNCCIFRLSTFAFDLAGANSTQQLAVLLSSFVQLVEDYKGLLAPKDFFNLSSFELSVKPHLFLSLAKIGALRLLIKKIALAYGLKEAFSPVFVIPSLRYLASREPHNNLLRLTSMNMSAIMGSASGFINFPYDIYSKSNNNLVLSRDRDLLLKKESFMDSIQDPYSGSYTMNHLIDLMGQSSWSFFQEIMAKGGLRQCLFSGWLQEQIKRESEKQIESFKKLETKMTGVNEFVLLESQKLQSSSFGSGNENSGHQSSLVEREQVQSIDSLWVRWMFKEDREKLCDVKKLFPFQMSQIFENWQFRADHLKRADSSFARLRTFIEPGLENSQRHRDLIHQLSLAGLEASHDPDRDCHPGLVIILALDPENTFCKEKLKSLNQKTSCFWAGEKSFPVFDGFIGKSSEWDLLFEKIFKVLEGSR